MPEARVRMPDNQGGRRQEGGKGDLGTRTNIKAKPQLRETRRPSKARSSVGVWLGGENVAAWEKAPGA